VIRFDDALSAGLAAIQERLGTRPASITFVRDVGGLVTAVLADDALGESDWDLLARDLDSRLGAFSPGRRRVLLRRSDLIDEADVLESRDRVRVPDTEDVWLVNRLLSNQDWLRRPLATRAPLPVAVGYSLKGGVGRSTALGVLAWHLARKGRRVLAVDLDLEAPGLGSLLLDELPDLGLIDWLVEALVGQAEPLLLQDCVGLSPVAKDAPGTVQVMPAFGRRTHEYVAKLGRVFLSSVDASGAEVGFAARLAAFLSAVRERDERPDVVLLDARAGLHDIAAAAVTQLGAETFLFARDEPQSWEAYRLLLKHLSASKGVTFGMPEDDLRWRLKMVGAQVDKTEAAQASWVEASYDVWSELYDEPQDSQTPTVARDDPDAPHYPLSIYFDSGLRGVSLADSGQRPLWPVVDSAFGEFLRGAEERLLGSAGRARDGAEGTQ